MLKLVILDDERMERTYMKKYVDWNTLGVEIAGEAANGVEGLKLCTEIRPDIIITDIKMPQMDGLEFAAKVKDVLPEVKIIFISGYGDFDYARSAVDLNAYGYILKPFRVSNVEEVVGKVVEKCLEEGSRNREREQLKKILDENKGVLKDSVIRELLEGTESEQTIWERVEFFGISLHQGLYSVQVMEIDDYEELSKSLTQEEKQLMSIELLQMTKSILESYGQGEMTRLSEKQFAILLSFDSSQGEVAARQKAYSLCDNIKNLLQEEMRLSVTFGMSEICRDIADLFYYYLQAKDALKYKLFDLKGQMISINDIRMDTEPDILDMKKIDDQLTDLLRRGEEEEIHRVIDRIFNGLLRRQDVSEGYLQNICISIVCVAMRFLNEVNCSFKEIFGDDSLVWSKLVRFETIGDVRQWLKNIFTAMLETIQMKKKSKNHLIVEKVMEIVNERYPEELTTRELSKEIFLSPNYIGAIFKDETGVGFLEYLTRIRMEKAAEMLHDPNKKIYEVAQKVGYNNTPYFSTLFKDYIGVTPSEYREKL